MARTAQKLAIEIRPMAEKQGGDWVFVAQRPPLRHWKKLGNFRVPEWCPSFEDLFWIFRAIAQCERKKYPLVKDPVRMPRALTAACWRVALSPDGDGEWLRLARKFKIEIRGKRSGNGLPRN